MHFFVRVLWENPQLREQLLHIPVSQTGNGSVKVSTGIRYWLNWTLLKQKFPYGKQLETTNTRVWKTF